MTIKKPYIVAIGVVIVLVSSVGGYMWYQGQQQEARLQERYDRWVTWSRTLVVGSGKGDLHPGIILGSGDADTIQEVLTATKPLWTDQKEFKPGVGVYNNLLVESWELKQNPEGQMMIEYKLKPGLKFTDGTPLNASAIAYCWDKERYELYDRKVNGKTGGRWWHENAWDHFEVPDPLTLQQILPVITRQKPFGGFVPMAFCALYSFRTGFCYSPTSSELYAKENSPIEDFTKEVGYGPFLLDEWVPNERFEFVVNENYPENPLGPYGGPSKCTTLDRVIAVQYPDPSSLRMALEKGEIDITAGIAVLGRADYDDLKNKPGITPLIAPWNGGQASIYFNRRPEFAPLNDSRVRMAIALAIDVDEINDKLLFGTAEIAHCCVRPVQPYFKPVFKPMRDQPMDVRLAQAKELLAEAGYPNGFNTEFWYPSGATEIFLRDLGTLIQAQLAKIGINCKPVLMEKATYNDFYNKGRIPMFMRAWTHDYVDPDSEIYFQMHSTSTYLTQQVGFNDSHIDELIDRGRELYDPRGYMYESPERAKIYEEIQDYTFETAFHIPLYYDSFYDLSRDWVKDFKYWQTCDMPYMGLWAARKEIPADWETREPPF